MHCSKTAVLLVLLAGPGWAQTGEPTDPRIEEHFEWPPHDLVQRDLARQEAVMKQLESLLGLMVTVSGYPPDFGYPPEVIAVLMDPRQDNPSRLRTALGRLHRGGTAMQAEPESREASDPAPDLEADETDPVPEPVGLSSAHLVFIRLPDANHPGVASLMIRSQVFSLAIGEKMVVDRKSYTLQQIYRDDAGRIVVVFEQGSRSIPLTWRG